jgi:Zn-dependent alcohol dehydrogenase
MRAAVKTEPDGPLEAGAGRLDPGGAPTRRKGLDQVNEAFDAIPLGDVIRSAIVPGESR